MGFGGDDDRKSERFQILGELHGEVMVLQPFAVKGISCGGIEIETGFALQLNSLHEFRLALGKRSVIAKGRVVRCAISDVDQDLVLYRSGIEFVELPPRVQTAIAEFIEGIRTGRQAL